MNKRILSSFALLALTATLAGAAQHDGQYGQRDNHGYNGGQNDQRNNGQNRYDQQAMATQESWAWRYDNLNLSWLQRRQMSNLTRQFRRDDDNLRNGILRSRDEYRNAIDRGQTGRAEQFRAAIFYQQGQLAQRRGWELDRIEGMLNRYQRAQFESLNGGRDRYNGSNQHWDEQHRNEQQH
jgi:hypothetical protein